MPQNQLWKPKIVECYLQGVDEINSYKSTISPKHSSRLKAKQKINRIDQNFCIIELLKSTLK